MIRLETHGSEEVLARFKGLSARLRQELRKSMLKAVIDLQGHIKADKLSGQVLHVRTNTLRSSIEQRVEETSDSVIGTDSTNVVYARLHEYGGTVTRHARSSLKTRGTTREHTAVYPERSFMRSALKDHRDRIRQDLQDAVARTGNA